MKNKELIAAVLILFVIVSVVYLFAKESSGKQFKADNSDSINITPTEIVKSNHDTDSVQQNPETADLKVDSESGQMGHKVIAYYFHQTKRCATCMRIEKYSNEAVNDGFKSELASGKLEWHVVNIDEQGNKHYLKDFELVTKSVVLVEMQDGIVASWKNLEKIWELNMDKEAFMKYIQDETRAFMDKI